MPLHAIALSLSLSEERRLFVGMLSKNLTEDDVKALFSVYGPVEDVSILRNKEGWSKGEGVKREGWGWDSFDWMSVARSCVCTDVYQSAGPASNNGSSSEPDDAGELLSLSLSLSCVDCPYLSPGLLCSSGGEGR